MQRFSKLEVRKKHTQFSLHMENQNLRSKLNMIIEIKQGKLEGVTQKSILSGNDYYAFLGIPYAQPPVGELRFRLPQPAEQWDGILSAKREPPACIQKTSSGRYTGNEDCLYLNVYTSTLPIQYNTPKAVMVYIPGGAFLGGSGSSEFHSPDYLIEYDIVLVTFNYRLHALGFLNMGTKNNDGNCGLQDQWLALKWVRENIRQFGGDPKNITIFGCSSGGISVYCHMISPKSKGLFHKAIIQSKDEVYVVPENRYNSQQIGFDLAKKLGFYGNDPEKLVEFLRNQPAMDIVRNIPHVFNDKGLKDGYNHPILFQPSIERSSDDAFLPDTIENLSQIATPVPLITGMTNKEGKLAYLGIDDTLLKILKNDFSKIIERPNNMSHLEFQNICDKITKRYLGDEPASEKTIENVVDIYTNYWYRKFYKSIDFIVNSGTPVYIYEFTFLGKFNFGTERYTRNLHASCSGATHADDLSYLFYPRRIKPNLKEICEPERTVINNICSLWTHFAKTGNPTENFNGIRWRPFTPEKPCFLRIDTDLTLVEEKLREHEFAFWNELLP